MCARVILIVLLHVCQGLSDITSTTWRFASEPADMLVTRGQTVRLDCSLHHKASFPPTNASSAVHVRWMKDGVFLSLDDDSRRRQLSNGSLVLVSVEHSKTRRSDEGLYQCLVVMPTVGSMVSRKARITVAYMSRQWSVEPEDHLLYPRDTAALRCDIDALPLPIFRWYKDGAELTPDNPRHIFHDQARVLELTNIASRDFGYYRCSASNSDERIVLTKTASLRQQTDTSAYLGVVPSFVIRPENKVVKEGSTVVFPCAANGRDRNEHAPTITWLKDGITIDTSVYGAERMSVRGQGSLYVEDVRETDSGTYICRATNDEDSVDTVATLIVEVLPKFLRWSADVVVGAVHGQVVVDCEVHGVPPPSVTWLKDGEVIVPSDYFQLVAGNSLRILGLVREDAGIYQCLVDSEIGSTQAATQLIVSSATENKMRPATVGPLTPRTIRHQAASSAQKLGRDMSPTNLRAILVSSRFMTVTWGVPDYPADISGYVIYCKEVGAQRERVVNTSSLEVSLQQLKPATAYDVTVVAVSQDGISTQGSRITVQTNSEVSSSTAPPRNVRVSSPSPNSLEVRWNVPEHLPGAIRHYKVYYYKMDDSEESEQLVGGASLMTVIHNLLPYKLYSIRVAVFNTNGTSVSSEDIVCRTLSDVPSAAPLNATLEATGASTMLLRWEAPPSDSQNGVITGYKIRYRKQGTRKTDMTWTTDGSERAHTLTDLEKDTVYMARVQALNINGSGPATDWLTAHTLQHDLLESIVPGQPRGLQARGMEHSVLINWLPPVDTDVKIRGYVLTYGIGAPFGFRVVLNDKLTTYTIRDLLLGTEYVISLSAYNKAGDGQPIYETVTTREETVEEQFTLYPPMGLKAIVLSSTTVHLTWSDNTHTGQASDSRIYTVRYSPKVTKDKKYKYINTTDFNLHIDGLKPHTDYEFAVKITKGRRSSAYSLSVTNTTSEDLPESYPRDLTLIKMDKDPTVVTLNWHPPRSPNGQITGYKVMYTADMTQDEDEWAEDHISGDKLSTVIKNLSPDTHYYFKIRARNSRGYGPGSPTVIFLTMSADGERGGKAIETPQDYGTAHHPIHATGRKTISAAGSSHDVRSHMRGMQPHAPAESTISESEKPSRELVIPALLLWVSMACIGGVSAIALVVIAALLCKRRSVTRPPADYKPTTAAPPAPKQTAPMVYEYGGQPPDLWIHDQLSDVKCHDDTAMSVCSSHPSSGRCDVDDLAATSTARSDRRRSSFHSQYSKESSEVYYNRIAAVRQLRPMMSLDMDLRPREDSGFERYHIRTPTAAMMPRRLTDDMSPVNSEPDDGSKITLERRVHHLPPIPTTGTRAASVSRSHSGVTSLTKKVPFTLSASTASVSPMKSLVFNTRQPPDVTVCRTECEPLQHCLPSSNALEECNSDRLSLSNEMASLQGLMEDISALGSSSAAVATQYPC